MTVGVTLGVMARAPVPGRCKTRLSPPLSPAEAADLYRALFEDSLAAYARVEGARLVVMAAPEDDGLAKLRELAPPPWEVLAQEGDGLGARLAHAFCTLGGDGAVALLDSDSPTVPIAPITRALAGLGRDDGALVGPCEDGGYYLIALGAVQPRTLEIVSEIPWSTSRVLAATRARCVSLGLQLAELPTWYDVDDGAALARLRLELRRDPARAPRSAAWLHDHAQERQQEQEHEREVER